MHGWSRIKTSVSYPTESEESYTFSNIIACNTYVTSSNVLSVVYANEALVVLFSLVLSDVVAELHKHEKKTKIFGFFMWVGA